MSKDVFNRCLMLGEYIVENKATVRQAGVEYGISKSTVHIDVTKRLMKISPSLAYEVAKVLEENKAERHIRGGLATKEKYQKLKDVEISNN